MTGVKTPNCGGRPGTEPVTPTSVTSRAPSATGAHVSDATIMLAGSRRRKNGMQISSVRNVAMGSAMRA